jgi:hypothetical protein
VTTASLCNAVSASCMSTILFMSLSTVCLY